MIGTNAVGFVSFKSPLTRGWAAILYNTKRGKMPPTVSVQLPSPNFSVKNESEKMHVLEAMGIPPKIRLFFRLA